MKISISNAKLTDPRKPFRYLRLDITLKRDPVDERSWTTLHACLVMRTKEGLVLRGAKSGAYVLVSPAPEIEEHVLAWLARPANMARYGNKIGSTARLLEGIDLGGGVAG